MPSRVCTTIARDEQERQRARASERVRECASRAATATNATDENRNEEGDKATHSKRPRPKGEKKNEIRQDPRIPVIDGEPKQRDDRDGQQEVEEETQRRPADCAGVCVCVFCF